MPFSVNWLAGVKISLRQIFTPLASKWQVEESAAPKFPPRLGGGGYDRLRIAGERTLAELLKLKKKNVLSCPL
jgi:hypothetical protein